MPQVAFEISRKRRILLDSESEYKNKISLDIREQYPDDDDEWQMTGKGVKIPAEKIPDFLRAVLPFLLKLAQEHDVSVEKPSKSSSKPKIAKKA